MALTQFSRHFNRLQLLLSVHAHEYDLNISIGDNGNWAYCGRDRWNTPLDKF